MATREQIKEEKKNKKWLLLLLLLLIWAVCTNLKLLIKSLKNSSAIPDLVWQIFYVYN